MTSEMLTTPTGNSLQRLGEAANDRLGGASRLFFEDQSFTGLQLAERARRLSQGFRDAGLKPGERVVVCMANCPEVGLTYNAVWRAGAANTPVLFLLSEDELRHVLSDSEAAYAVTTPEFLPKTGAARGVPTAHPPEPTAATRALGDTEATRALREPAPAHAPLRPRPGAPRAQPAPAARRAEPRRRRGRRLLALLVVALILVGGAAAIIASSGSGNRGAVHLRNVVYRDVQRAVDEIQNLIDQNTK